MQAKKLKLGFIGAGRAGTGLASGFARAGSDVVAIASRSAASARALARRVPGARICAPQEVADRADIVFLTVPDDAIEPVASGIRWRPGAACVHCSGAADLDVLKKAAADGALAGGFHPLHMFGERGNSSGTLRGCAIALAGPDALVRKMERLARALGAKPLRLPEGGRALYHAAANFSGAFVIALIQETIALWKKLGIAEADALAALLPFLRGTVDNVEKLGAAGGLGSAVARGDVGTIRRHLDVLAKEAPESLELYRILSLRTLPLALAKGTLKPKASQEIIALLQSRGVSPLDVSVNTVASKVLMSLENQSGDHCVDIFVRADGTFGFEEYRRDHEDGRGWFPLHRYAHQVFDTEEDALAQAKSSVEWLV